jgi:hypothetical protein
MNAKASSPFRAVLTLIGIVMLPKEWIVKRASARLSSTSRM